MDGQEMRRRILTLNQVAHDYLAYAEDLTRVKEIEALLSSSTLARLPLETQGVLFTAEGIETAYLAPEPMPLRFALPAYRAGWDVVDGLYRLFVEVEEPCTLSATTAGGATLFKNRRISQSAVVDVRSGSVRLEATAPIRRLQVTRFQARAQGSILLGPFRAHGHVEARAIGHGDWRCEIAYDYNVLARIERGELSPPAPATEPYGQVWDLFGLRPTGAPTLPWSVARQFEPTTGALPAPVFQRRLPVGKIYAGSEDALYGAGATLPYSTTEPSDFWAGVGEWASPNEMDEPDFDDVPGFWAYVWGTATDAKGAQQLAKAYDAETGDPVRLETVAAHPGFYLVKALAPSRAALTVEVVGLFAKYGEPLRTSTDPLLLAHNNAVYVHDATTGLIVPPGAYRRLRYAKYPDAFLVRATGSGILRGIEIKARTNATRPDAAFEDKVYREELSTYRDPDAHWGGPRRQPGPNAGLVLPVRG